jgi:hypothetical protein
METSENIQKDGQGTASIGVPTPTTFKVDAAKVLVDAYMNIVAASAKATPLHKAYVARMQEASGYEVVPDLKADLAKSAGVALKMIAEGELTKKGIERAVTNGLIRLVDVKPDAALLKAAAALSGAVADFNTVVKDITLPLLITTPKGKKNVNMPAGERTRTASKGFISIDEWNSIPSAEKVQYSMVYDEVGITLNDINGNEHYCKAFGALKRHENGEGHKA